jgi:tetratricopeptide (TPR) repeat protein
MWRPRLRNVAFVLALSLSVVSAVATVGRSALGDGSKPAAAGKKGAPAQERYDPDNITAISQYMKTLVEGNARYAAKDYAGAVDIYRKAIALNPKSPLGHYLLGEGQLAAGNVGEAEAAFLAAQEVSDSRNPTLRSHVLFAVADVFERQKKWPEAQKAWQAYTEHASKYGGDAGLHPATGAERLKVLDKVLTMEKAYVEVRARIASEKDGGADAGKK